MSNLDPHPQESLCGGTSDVSSSAVHELLIGRDVVLGGTRGMPVSRTLPNKHRRMVGAWCFVDYYGPEDISGSAGMRVPPHPHTGLQTVSWLVAGEVLHRDLDLPAVYRRVHLAAPVGQPDLDVAAVGPGGEIAGARDGDRDVARVSAEHDLLAP